MRFNIILLISLLIQVGCATNTYQEVYVPANLTPDILNYAGIPNSPEDRNPLAFSDQGAWFAYSLPDKQGHHGGFSGPFLMTQDNGVWISPMLSRLEISDAKTRKEIDWKNFVLKRSGFSSHLEQKYSGEKLIITMQLYFISPHTAFTTVQIENVSNSGIELSLSWKGDIFLKSIKTEKRVNGIKMRSEKSNAEGFIIVSEKNITSISVSGNSYGIDLKNLSISKGGAEGISISHTFIFPEYSIDEEIQRINKVSLSPLKILRKRIDEKSDQLRKLFLQIPERSKSTDNRDLIAKSALTMQNNWRIPAGELKYSGLFPSYNYKWFHGFWGWDSWKHAAALAKYDIDLAKEQVRAMYNFQEENGMIADCVYRDTSIEKHNYRNTKPPLSAWAVWRIYREDGEISFLEEMFKKIIKQHNWWYKERDHDQDGICEYGCTDGTLVAAKWESGMDNGVRFDKSRLLKNSGSAWSLDQESVDLNSYLYAEKIFLSKISKELNKYPLYKDYKREAAALKKKIRNQFYDNDTGWFYDTSIDGKNFIKVIGCEGWIPLWAKAADAGQASKVRNTMVDPLHFNRKVPLQTLSADDPQFDPVKGYWRGPVWLDQTYFGVMGLRNYGFSKEAERISAKLIRNSEGVITHGKSLRENYDPITGNGLNARNFSWTAAHFMLLLLDE